MRHAVTLRPALLAGLVLALAGGARAHDALVGTTARTAEPPGIGGPDPAGHAAEDGSALALAGLAVPALVRTAVVNGSYDGLPAQGGGDGPEFGQALAIDGDWLAVGAPGTLVDHGGAFGGSKPAGAVFLFQRVGDTWQPALRLTPAQFGVAPRCGQAVALRGRNLLVGCPGAGVAAQPGSGHGTYLAWRRDLDEQWQPIPINASSSAGAQCGAAVAVSASGINGIAEAAIGCPGWNGNRGRVNAHQFDGLAGSWSAPAFVTASDGAGNDRFGASVSVYRPLTGGLFQRLAVGAPDKLDDLNPQAGRVYVFEGSSWATQAANITGLQSGERFGTAVAVHADQLAVGSLGGVSSACGVVTCGKATRYARIGGVWAVQDGSGPVNAGGQPPGPQPEMAFGSALAIAPDGLIAVAGPRADGATLTLPPGTAADVGMVELRRNDDGTPGLGAASWQAELRPGALSGLALAGGRFGSALDFSGTTLAIGYPRSGTAITGRRGQVWIHEDDRLFADGFQ